MSKTVFPKDFEFIPPPDDWMHNRLAAIDTSHDVLVDHAQLLVEVQGEIDEVLVKQHLKKMTIDYLFADFIKLTLTDDFINGETQEREDLVTEWLKFHLCNPMYEKSAGLYRFLKDNYKYFL